MLGILRTLLPLLAGTALLLVWAVVVVVVVIRWAVGQFQAEKAASGAIVLLLFLLLPVAAGLLGHLFFSSTPKTEAGGGSVFSEWADRLIDGQPKDGGGASSGAAGTDTAAPGPWALSDEELMVLAEDAYADMVSMYLRRYNGDLLPCEEEYQTLTDANGEIIVEGYRVRDYTTLEEVCQALDEIWFEKFAHGGTSSPSEEVRSGQGGIMYTEYDGAVYVLDGGVGSQGSPPVVDELVSRDDREAIFRGHWESAPDNVFTFSLMFEDGRWKYGRENIQ